MGKMQRDKGALCGCGCGESAPIAPYTLASKGWVGGEPLRFVHGHNARRDPGHVVTPSGCWEWQGGQSGNGYGRASRSGRLYAAHRWYYEQANGPIPAGLVLDHLCVNRICVNPDHLEPVTQAENSRRSSNTRLTAELVAELRDEAARELEARRAAGFVRRGLGWQRRMAAKYGISVDHVKHIVRGAAWAR